MTPAKTLTGVRVVNFGLNLPGPMLVRRLAKRGADVTHVEPPDGDPTRSMFVNPFGDPLLYRWLHQHATSITLDLKQPDDFRLARAQCAEADVIVDGFLPGTLAKLGLDSHHLRRDNPRLIYCSVTGFGDRARRAMPGHDLNFLATSGLIGSLGLSPDRPLPLFPIGDIAGGVLQAETEILAALFARHAPRAPHTDHQGFDITVSIADALADLDVVSRVAAAVPDDQSSAFLSGAYACYRLYWAAKRTMLALGALEHKFWARFCHLIGTPELVASGFAKRNDGTDVHSIVESALLAHDAATWEALSMHAPCCVTRVA